MNDKIKRVRNRVTHRSDEIIGLASQFSALNSYMRRKMQPKEADWCAKWIYEIMDTLDYILRSQEEECEIFSELYGVNLLDLRFWQDCDYRMGEIKEIMEEFHRAVATYGEVKLSVGKPIGKPICPDYDIKSDRSHNLQMINDYKASIQEEEI